MSSPEQVTAPNCPESQSVINLTPFECGMIEHGFHSAIHSHGNDEQLIWPSYVESNPEVFTLRRYGGSSSFKNTLKDFKVGDYSDLPFPQLGEDVQMSKWLLDFGVRNKCLLIDLGTDEIVRFEGEFTVPASNNDISDIVGTYSNLIAYREERRSQGWDPELDFEQGIL